MNWEDNRPMKISWYDFKCYIDDLQNQINDLKKRLSELEEHKT